MTVLIKMTDDFKLTDDSVDDCVSTLLLVTTVFIDLRLLTLRRPFMRIIYMIIHCACI